MKKIVAILLVFCISLSICACGNNDKQPKETESNNIALNEENITELLNVKVSPYVENRKRRAKVEIYPIQAGDFSNTKVHLKLKTDNVCTIFEIVGEKYEEFESDTRNEYFVVEITLPVNGTYEFDVGFACWLDTTEPIKNWEFQDISGTFIPR